MPDSTKFPIVFLFFNFRSGINCPIQRNTFFGKSDTVYEAILSNGLYTLHNFVDSDTVQPWNDWQIHKFNVAISISILHVKFLCST